MNSRRNFIGAMASGLATSLANPKGVLGSNDRIRVGVIGAGDRGTEIAHRALRCPNANLVGASCKTNPRQRPRPSHRSIAVTT